MRFEYRYEKTVPRLSALACHKGQRRLVGYHVRHPLDTAQAFGHRTKGREHLAIRLAFHPHRHRDVVAIGHLNREVRLDVLGGFRTALAIYIEAKPPRLSE